MKCIFTVGSYGFILSDNSANDGLHSLFLSMFTVALYFNAYSNLIPVIA